MIIRKLIHDNNCNKNWDQIAYMYKAWNRYDNDTVSFNTNTVKMNIK